MFQTEGIHYTLNGKTGNTLNSHRLIALAGRQGTEVQDRMVNSLFRAYFEEVRLALFLVLQTLTSGSSGGGVGQAAEDIRGLLEFLGDFLVARAVLTASAPWQSWGALHQLCLCGGIWESSRSVSTRSRCPEQ